MRNLLIYGHYKQWRHWSYVIINWHFRNLQIITSGAHAHLFHVLSHAIFHRFRVKFSWRTYDFSWLYFDKIFSQKKCKGMLNQTCLRPFRDIPAFNLPHNVVRKRPSDVLILPISSYDIAHFRGWKAPYRTPMWPISHAEMVHIVKW